MTDEMIKIALKCCSVNRDCSGCPLDEYDGEESCVVKVKKEAFDMINRQKVEIDILIRKKDNLLDEIAELKQEAEVVRCKDCDFVKQNSSSGLYHCNRRGFYSEEVKPDGFCGYGERGAK